MVNEYEKRTGLAHTVGYIEPNKWSQTLMGISNVTTSKIALACEGPSLVKLTSKNFSDKLRVSAGVRGRLLLFQAMGSARLAKLETFSCFFRVVVPWAKLCI